MTQGTRSDVRVVVEVDGTAVGFLNLDIDRLWPLLNHREGDSVPFEWMDPARFASVMRATVVKRLIKRLETHLYETLGSEMVKAELDVESFTLKAEAAAQAFGTTRAEIEKMVAETGASLIDFYTFFWDYLLDDGDVTDLKKEWKKRDTRPR